MAQSETGKEIEIYSHGHFSTKGSLEHELVEWGILIDGNYCFQFFGEHVLKGDQGVRFFHSIKPHLPQDYEERIIPPVHIPGDGYSLRIPMAEFQDGGIYDIISSHFPNSLSENPNIDEDRIKQELSQRRVSEKMVREHLASRLLERDGNYISILNTDSQPTYFGYLGTGLSPQKCSELSGEDDPFIRLYAELIHNQPRAGPFSDLADPMITIFLTEVKRRDALYSDRESRWDDFQKYEGIQRKAIIDLAEIADSVIDGGNPQKKL